MAASPRRGLVLVADDDPVMRLLMLEMLARWAWTPSKPKTANRRWLSAASSPTWSCSTSTCRAWTALPCAAKSASRNSMPRCPSSWSPAATNWNPSPRLRGGRHRLRFQAHQLAHLGHRVLYVLRASDAISRLRIADAAPRRAGRHPRHLFRMNRDGYYLDYEQGHEASGVFASERCVGQHLQQVLPEAIARHMLAQVHSVLASSTSARSTTPAATRHRPRTRRRACGSARAPFRSAAGGDRPR
jgi:hypothetical protein